MINRVYQLLRPYFFSVKYEDMSTDHTKQVIVRPHYLALCHADQRYYQGKRASRVLQAKLPMALIHEACGTIVHDETGTYQVGETVVMIPNQPPREREHNTEFYENYMTGTHFLSSGYDGFMQEFVYLPIDRVVPYVAQIPGEVAAITEFVSVGVHGVRRFDAIAHSRRERIVVWGSGSLAFVVATVLRARYPESTIIIVGKNQDKLRLFSFVDEVYDLEDVPTDFHFDHAFECVGGDGCQEAYRDIIHYIKPQGTVIMMGVSETEVPLNTRDILEKGLSFIGSSRSGREDFEQAAQLMEEPRIASRLQMIIHQTEPIQEVTDIYQFFEEDRKTPFKTVAKWQM